MNNQINDQAKPEPLPYVAAAPLYIQGKHKTGGQGKPAILSANENPFGASPKVKAHLQDLMDDLHRYPDGGASVLKAALGKLHHFTPEQIIFGNGSDELITLICRAFVAAGDEVLSSQYGFLMYEINAKLVGGISVKAPEINRRSDCDALLAAISDKTRVIFLANPNNPTGSYLTKDELHQFQQKIPPSVLLVIDAAYSEYAAALAQDYDDGADLARNQANVLMLRTFSKAYGLAGLRLGWAAGSAGVIETLNRVRSVFNVSSMAQAAGLVALADQDYIHQAQEHNRQEKHRLFQSLQGLASQHQGWRVEPSVGNFLLLDFATPATAAALDDYLLGQGVIVRRMDGYGLPTCLRVTVGTTLDNDRFLTALGQFATQ